MPAPAAAADNTGALLLAGWCRDFTAHALGAFHLYQPETSLLTYLMYYHTLLWVVCKPPGEEHIPMCAADAEPLTSSTARTR